MNRRDVAPGVGAGLVPARPLLLLFERHETTATATTSAGSAGGLYGSHVGSVPRTPTR
jgi:hypothetical protein